MVTHIHPFCPGSIRWQIRYHLGIAVDSLGERHPILFWPNFRTVFWQLCLLALCFLTTHYERQEHRIYNWTWLLSAAKVRRQHRRLWEIWLFEWLRERTNEASRERIEGQSGKRTTSEGSLDGIHFLMRDYRKQGPLMTRDVSWSFRSSLNESGGQVVFGW